MMHSSSPTFATRSRLLGSVAWLPVLGVIDAARGAPLEAPALMTMAWMALGSSFLVELLRGALRRLPVPEAAIAVPEAAIAMGWLFAVEPIRAFDGKPVWLVAVVGGIGLGYASLALRGHRRLDLAFSGLGLVAAVAAHVTREPTLYPSIHAACVLLAAVSAARLAERLAPSEPVRVPRALGLATLALVSSDLALSRSAELRHAVFVRSAHGAPLASVVGLLGDVDFDGSASMLGSVDCDPLDNARGPYAVDRPGDGIDQDCDGFDSPGPSSAKAATTRRDADVLFLSVDALRADAANELVETRRALGPFADFRRAVSPAPRTANTFASTLRGVLLEAVPFDRSRFRAPILQGDPPSIGARLAGHGYRSVYVASHAYLEAPLRVVTGFERVGPEPSAFPERASGMVPSTAALSALLDAAGSTRGPLFAWAHLMEAHEPYRLGPQRWLSNDMAGYRAALRGIDARIAAFLPEFRRVRGGRPVIVAVFGDHGEAFGEHGTHRHSSSVHVEQVRVPLLLAFDGVARTVDTPTTLAALPATVLEALGLPVPERLVPSVVRCVREGADCPREARSDMMSSNRSGARALRAHTSRTHRCIVDRAHDVGAIYDSAADPGEHRPRVVDARQAVAFCGGALSSPAGARP